jgi:hypothetical protein
MRKKYFLNGRYDVKYAENHADVIGNNPLAHIVAIAVRLFVFMAKRRKSLFQGVAIKYKGR